MSSHSRIVIRVLLPKLDKTRAYLFVFDFRKYRCRPYHGDPSLELRRKPPCGACLTSNRVTSKVARDSQGIQYATRLPIKLNLSR
jgi:hypothetical protein